MAEKILYYLGAGASAKVLPLARSVKKPMPGNNEVIEKPGLAYELRTFLHEHVIPQYSEVVKHKLQQIRANAIGLANEADKFGDVDTYAKYLQLLEPGGERLKELKKTLAQYFSIKQALLESRDDRYIQWLVSIMTRKRFPENIKILSWNYDYQVQLAAMTLFNEVEEVSHSPRSYIYSPSMLCHFPNLDPYFTEYSDLSLIQLNGIAGYSRTNELITSSIYQMIGKKNELEMVEYLSTNSLNSMLHFAWENSGYHKQLMEHVSKMIERTTIMVVIGYSFPFFNREVDKEVFQSLLKGGNTLRKIYYQDPKLDGQQLYAQFNLPDSIKIEHIKQTDNFHVPFEY